MAAKTECRRQAVERLLAESRYDWTIGADIGWKPDAEEHAADERRMAERYRNWAGSSPVCYAPSKYESACRTYRNMPYETVNPIDDTIELPEPHYDGRLKKWIVPKNVFDGNVLSRRRFLFEIDGMALADQKVLLEPLLRGEIIQRVVFSGNKSLHCVIEEADEPDDNEQYRWVWHYLAREYFRDKRFHCLRLPLRTDKNFPEVVDSNCSNPSRTTRSPFALRKDDKTGGQPVEQKLLYFENVRLDSGWRRGWNAVKARYEAEMERMRKQARRDAWKYRNMERKVPNENARRFIGADMSDGWKHGALPSAVASLVACGYGLAEVAAIFRRYETVDGRKSDLPVYAMKCYDEFERRDRGKAVDWYTRRNGPAASALAAEAMG